MSRKQTVERAIRFANRPTHANWSRLFGEVGISGPPGEPDLIGALAERLSSTGADSRLSEYVSRPAGWFRAALSDIAHGRQTREQVQTWTETANGLEAVSAYTIVERKQVREDAQGHRAAVTVWQVREEIGWRPRRDVFAVASIDPGSPWQFVTVDAEGQLATVLMWLLNPELPFAGLHECGRGEQCDRERFYFRNRKYCDPKHGQQMNRATNTERSRDRRARDKAIELLKPRFPKSARELVWAVKARGVSAEELVQRALEHHEQERHK